MLIKTKSKLLIETFSLLTNARKAMLKIKTRPYITGNSTKFMLKPVKSQFTDKKNINNPTALKNEFKCTA
jgi:hypothetical protein